MNVWELVIRRQGSWTVCRWVCSNVPTHAGSSDTSTSALPAWSDWLPLRLQPGELLANFSRPRPLTLRLRSSTTPLMVHSIPNLSHTSEYGVGVTGGSAFTVCGFARASVKLTSTSFCRSRSCSRSIVARSDAGLRVGRWRRRDLSRLVRGVLSALRSTTVGKRTQPRRAPGAAAVPLKMREFDGSLRRTPGLCSGCV